MRCVGFHLGCTAYNLGTGHGTSVLEMVTTFEKASGKVILHPPDIILINVYTCIYRCACACTND
jgi:hypothetical protein